MVPSWSMSLNCQGVENPLTVQNHGVILWSLWIPRPCLPCGNKEWFGASSQVCEEVEDLQCVHDCSCWWFKPDGWSSSWFWYFLCLVSGSRTVKKKEWFNKDFKRIHASYFNDIREFQFSKIPLLILFQKDKGGVNADDADKMAGFQDLGYIGHIWLYQEQSAGGRWQHLGTNAAKIFGLITISDRKSKWEKLIKCN